MVRRVHVARVLVMAVTLLSIACVGLYSSAQASERTPIFEQAPPPATLARILFPPKTRGLLAKNDANKEKLFGLMVNFAFNSSAITSPSEPLLNSVGEMMRLETVKKRSIIIEGHTDAVGTDIYNQDLSIQRAQAIALYLIVNYDIAPQRLITLGKGESELYDTNKPNARINRRAMFRAYEKSDK